MDVQAILFADVERELLTSIFFPNSPLHDGGVIIQGQKIEAARCIFPVSEARRLDPHLGLRHRAAIGLTERTDAFVIVTSEETGAVSVAENGKLDYGLSIGEVEARRLYERYAIPASGGILWGSVLANFEPGKQDVAVDYHNEDRAPLLFVSGGEDHIMPPSIQRSNAKHYKSPRTTTEIQEFPGRSHLLPAQPGWEEVADYALEWAERHARGTAGGATAGQ